MKNVKVLINEARIANAKNGRKRNKVTGKLYINVINNIIIKKFNILINEIRKIEDEVKKNEKLRKLV